MKMARNLDYITKKIYSNLEIENIDQWDRYAGETAPKDYEPLSVIRTKYPEIEEKEFKKRMKIIIDMMKDRGYNLEYYKPKSRKGAPNGCLVFRGDDSTFWHVAVFPFMRYDDEYFRNNLLTALFED